MTIELTDKNYETFTSNNSKSILIDFWAPRCGPCKMLNPLLEELSTEYSEDVIIAKVNVDTNSKLALKFGVRSIPTILFIKQGQITGKHVGATSKNVLETKLIANLL